jgi:hypothetical protein
MHGKYSSAAAQSYQEKKKIYEQTGLSTKIFLESDDLAVSSSVGCNH